MVTVVGELHFQQAGQSRTAWLGTDLHWCCDDKQLERFLNEACCIEHAPQGLDERQSAIHGLYQTAERLGAEVKVPRPALRPRK